MCATFDQSLVRSSGSACASSSAFSTPAVTTGDSAQENTRERANPLR